MPHGVRLGGVGKEGDVARLMLVGEEGSQAQPARDVVEATHNQPVVYATFDTVLDPVRKGNETSHMIAARHVLETEERDEPVVAHVYVDHGGSLQAGLLRQGTRRGAAVDQDEIGAKFFVKLGVPLR